MNVVTYTISDDNNKVNKSLGAGTTYEGVVMKEPTDVTAPTIRITSTSNLSNVNYCYIERYGRYYFVDRIIAVNNGLWELVCRCDVLMSYRLQILKLKGTVNRGERIYNGYLNDPEYKSYSYTETIVRKFPDSFEGTDALILLTVG